jgi:predicted RNA binding protein YcfA (HicA-like mRNA interferase family)
MNFRDVERTLLAHGFALVRQRGSHRRYEGFVGGERRLVTLAFTRPGDEVLPNIRQSGLPKRLFR